VDFGGPRPFGGPGHATVDWHGRSTDGPGQAEGQAGLGATAHSDALAPHKDEATEAQDAEWDSDDDEDAPSHDEEEPHADNDEEEDAPTPDVAEATAEKAAADHDPGTDDCFSGE
jgi:hypothetical protein